MIPAFNLMDPCSDGLGDALRCSQALGTVLDPVEVVIDRNPTLGVHSIAFTAAIARGMFPRYGRPCDKP